MNVLIVSLLSFVAIVFAASCHEAVSPEQLPGTVSPFGIDMMRPLSEGFVEKYGCITTMFHGGVSSRYVCERAPAMVSPFVAYGVDVSQGQVWSVDAIGPFSEERFDYLNGVLRKKWMEFAFGKFFSPGEGDDRIAIDLSRNSKGDLRLFYRHVGSWEKVELLEADSL